MSTYKVTALKNVTFKANVRTPDGERREWITLRAGEVRDGLGLVFEVHPSHGLSLQEQSAPDEVLPKVIGGLFRLEISKTSA
jgi:hypothetical protein